ncbi:hypothetical protein EDC04DRAFT_1107603 [Pisolithus marmoratus]|nr:hypothetical protein EDC04DRAFT_1107603 [Pisolithus marmoratus]
MSGFNSTTKYIRVSTHVVTIVGHYWAQSNQQQKCQRSARIVKRILREKERKKVANAENTYANNNSPHGSGNIFTRAHCFPCGAANGVIVWALVVSQPGENSLQGRVNVYQIVRRHPGCGCELSHKIVDDSNGAVLQRSRRYYGTVDLVPLYRVTTDHLFHEIKRQSAEQGTYSLPPGKQWSCAWWVIRSLRRLENKGYVFPGLSSDNLELYNQVVGQNRTVPMRASP